MNTSPFIVPAHVQAAADALMAGARDRFGHGQFRMDGASDAVIDRLEQERQGRVDFIEQTLQQVETRAASGGEGDLVQAEEDNLRAARERIQAIDAQLEPLRQFAALRQVHRQEGSGYRPASGGNGNQPDTRMGARTEDRPAEYRTAGQIIVDGLLAGGYVAPGQRREADQRAVQRLRSIGVGYEDGMLVRTAQMVEELGPQGRAAVPHTTTAEFPGILTTTVVGDIMSDIDAARPFISSLGAKDLAGIPGTTFNRPVVTQHVTVGKQANQKDEVAEGQFKVGSVAMSKETYGGWTNVAKQVTDWLSPAVWDALLLDFQEIYGLQTEDVAADDFVASVTQVTAVAKAGPSATIAERLTALYKGASQAYAGAKRLPNHIWQSLDEWATWGPLVDQLKATTAGNGGGDSSVTDFAGQLLNTPRTIVPSFASGTTIIGVKEKYEVYEDRFGFLSAVQPRVFGIELAYGGYMAKGQLNASAFSKVTFTGP